MNQVPSTWYYYSLIALISAVFMWLFGFLFCAMQGAELSSINWMFADAQHYAGVQENGYQDSHLAAFFPLFPFLWRLLGFSGFGIGLANAVFYLAGASLLGSSFKLSLKYFVFFCYLPLNVFFFLPYSEALFAFAMVLFLIGAYKWNWYLLILGIVICSFARPTAALFIPALLLATALVKEPRALKKKLFILPLIAAISFGGVLFIQQLDTGNLLSFFEAQKSWGSYWRIPSYPLTTWGNGFNTILDALSLFISTVCGIAFIRAWHKKLTLSFVEWFSLAFLAGTGLLVVLTRGGELYSLSRFIFCVPLFPFAMAVLFKENLVSRNLFLVVLFVFPWLFGIHVHIQAAAGGLLAAVVVLIFTFLWKSNTQVSSVLALAILFILQAFCCSLFLKGYWLA